MLHPILRRKIAPVAVDAQRDNVYTKDKKVLTNNNLMHKMNSSLQIYLNIEVKAMNGKVTQRIVSETERHRLKALPT